MVGPGMEPSKVIACRVVPWLSITTFFSSMTMRNCTTLALLVVACSWACTCGGATRSTLTRCRPSVVSASSEVLEKHRAMALAISRGLKAFMASSLFRLADTIAGHRDAGFFVLGQTRGGQRQHTAPVQASGAIRSAHPPHCPNL